MKSFITIYPNLLQFFEILNFKSKFKPGKKNQIKEFSSKARRNFIFFVNSIKVDEFFNKYFITLTYHNDYPTDLRLLKLDLKKFLIYSRREFPQFEYIWKLEIQKRNAPHYHLAFFFTFQLSPNQQNYFTQKINNIWNEITSCKCNHCKLYKSKVYSINNQYVFYSYMTKEITKNKQTEIIKLGRFWGHSKNLKVFKWTTEEISIEEWKQIKQKILEHPKYGPRLIKYFKKLPDYVEPKNFLIPADISLKAFFEIFDKRYSSQKNEEKSK